MDNKNKQEENVETFSDNIEKKKEKSAKVKRIIGLIIRIITPWLLLPVLILVLLAIRPILFSKNDTGYGNIAIFLLFVFIAFFPFYGLIYGIFIAKSEKRKYLFALYNPAVSTLIFYIIKIFYRFINK